MTGIDKNIASDFALFDDIVEDLEIQEREKESEFHASPTHLPTPPEKDNIYEHKDEINDTMNIQITDRSSFNITNYKNTTTESDTSSSPKYDPNSNHKDFNEIQTKRNEVQINTDSEEDSPDNKLESFLSDEKLDSEQSSHSSAENNSGNDTDEQDEQESNHEKKKIHRVKFADNYYDDSSTSTTRKLKMTSYYNNFCDIFDERDKKKSIESGGGDSFDINTVADENKYLISPLKEKSMQERKQKTFASTNDNSCQCKSCPNNIYNQTNFPVLESLFKDQEEPVTRKKTLKKKTRIKKKTKTELENKDSSKKEYQLDSSLKDSGNPVLLGWLDQKNKLLREKRRKEKRERKLQRKEEKLKELESFRSKQTKNSDKLQEWINRKKDELKQKRLSSFLEKTDQFHPIQHNQMTRPKSVKQRNNKTTAKTSKTNQTAFATDLLSPKKTKRPSTSPSKKTISDKISFDEFRSKYLSKEDTPVGYTSVQLYVEKIVNNAVEELKISKRKQEQKKRPQTAVVRTNTAVWRPNAHVSVNSTPTQQSFENSPSEQQEKPVKTYEKWLTEKRERDKNKRKEKLKNDYFDKLEQKVLLDEKERRRIEIETSKKRVNTGLRREKKQYELFGQNNKAPGLMVRLEPQGSENLNESIVKLNSHGNKNHNDAQKEIHIDKNHYLS